MALKQAFRLFAVLFLSVLLIFVYNHLEWIGNTLVYESLGFSESSHLGQSIHFFVYESIKILILLFFISLLMGIVNAYFPVERLRIYLSNKKLYGLEYLMASVFGAVTPFCSCSSIPLFIGFLKGGIPLGITFSFLITSPLVNEIAIALFLGLFGVKITLIYACSGIVLGILGGYLLGKMKLEKYLTDWVQDLQKQSTQQTDLWEEQSLSFIERLPFILTEVKNIIKKVLLYVLLGIAVGAFIHGYVPQDFFAEYLSSDRWYAVPLAVVLAVPMYANAVAIVPVIQVLVSKGVALGTAIAFMMAVVGLSLPEATLLKQVMKWKLIFLFFGTISLFIILLGLFFNVVI